MKRKFLVAFVLSTMFFSSCMTSRAHLLYSDIKSENLNFKISSIESDFDGMKNPVVEEQVAVIAKSLIDSAGMKNRVPVNLEIKIFEKNYLCDIQYVRSIFLCCSLFDEDDNELAVFSEFSTGNDTFNSPSVQEKFLKKCIAEIKKMEL
ncbi:hypothetical protein [Treponema sp.]|uniref:hypothetical protein n=1 Tax=Treponema sp. TaxID=166 RepID=UPI00298DB443|nr:hypothetical protein [Treponema sp.]MCQ2241447.1 hypothetical protein [Treponema sp.]